ncbi:hypothetical protein I6A84_21730 [Frankia sp. CNm7]|nr:hypothetical protein [Frankia nepalensis]MBL7520637.1 hypothetical protein [Frankia nepalensis]
MPWVSLLALPGLLAVITHAESHGGWLVDPIVDITAAAFDSGLALVDRIVLVEVPLQDLLSADAAGSGRFDDSPGPIAMRRACSDLLVFAVAARDMSWPVA